MAKKTGEVKDKKQAGKKTNVRTAVCYKCHKNLGDWHLLGGHFRKHHPKPKLKLGGRRSGPIPVSTKALASELRRQYSSPLSAQTVRRVKKGVKVNLEKKEVFKCDNCNKPFPTKQGRAGHVYHCDRKFRPTAVAGTPKKARIGSQLAVGLKGVAQAMTAEKLNDKKMIFAQQKAMERLEAAIPAVLVSDKKSHSLEQMSFAFDINVPTGTSRAWMQAIVDIVKANLELMSVKNHDYGRENISDFDWVGVVIRMNDKWQRLRNAVKFLLKGEKLAVSEETVDDIFNDLMNYAVIGRMVRNGRWLL